MNARIMTKEEILNSVAELSRSQGFYERLYETLKDNPEYLDELAEQDFSDVIDLILYLES